METMEEELYPIEVVLTYMATLGGMEAIMLVKTAPTNDYESGTRAAAWVNRAKTGRCRVIVMTPVNGDGGGHGGGPADVPLVQRAEAEKTCPMEDCTLGPEHVLPHQDLEGDRWDSLGVRGERVINPRGTSQGQLESQDAAKS